MVVYEHSDILSETAQRPKVSEGDKPNTVTLQPRISQNVPHVVTLAAMSADNEHALTVGKLAHRPH
ncbi:UNVERIFIED_ORG: hypothetical protein ABIC48_002022 [Burkholderia territorii]